jgi:hypothetical protein
METAREALFELSNRQTVKQKSNVPGTLLFHVRVRYDLIRFLLKLFLRLLFLQFLQLLLLQKG